MALFAVKQKIQNCRKLTHVHAGLYRNANGELKRAVFDLLIQIGLLSFYVKDFKNSA